MSTVNLQKKGDFQGYTSERRRWMMDTRTCIKHLPHIQHSRDSIMHRCISKVVLQVDHCSQQQEVLRQPFECAYRRCTDGQ